MAFAKSILVPAEEILRISCLHDGNESFETTRACIRVFAIRSESRDRPMPIVRVNVFFFSFRFFEESNDAIGRTYAFYPRFAQAGR